MSDTGDNGRALLEKLLSQLYEKAGEGGAPAGANDLYLVAEDGQYLGRLTSNTFDTNSIANEYGPYGSQYSSTSIFNEYGQYGSQYSHLSPRNPYTTTPPRLFLRGQLNARVSDNPYLEPRIPFDTFVYALRHELDRLLAGQPIAGGQIRLGDTYIRAADGAFLGSLNPNRYDTQSIFNKYGPFGSPYSATSIFNRYGQYGGAYAPFSPFNRYSVRPPEIVKDGTVIAPLTVSTQFARRILPDDLFNWAERNVQKRY